MIRDDLVYLNPFVHRFPNNADTDVSPTLPSPTLELPADLTLALLDDTDEDVLILDDMFESARVGVEEEEEDKGAEADVEVGVSCLDFQNSVKRIV